MQYARLFYCLLINHLVLYSRAKGRLLSAVLFFVLVGALFPMAGIDSPLLPTIGPSVIWIAALCAALLSLDGLLQNDLEEGRLEYMMLSPYPLPLFMLAQCIAHWCFTGLPLVCLAPLLGLLFNMKVEGFWALITTLWFGTGILHGLGALVSTLTLGIHQGGLLLMLCVLPLAVPVLIIGVSAVQYASMGLPWSGQCALLAALWIMVLLCIPLGMAMAVKISAE